MVEIHTLYKGLSLRSGKRVADYESCCLRKRDYKNIQDEKKYVAVLFRRWFRFPQL